MKHSLYSHPELNGGCCGCVDDKNPQNYQNVEYSGE